MQSKAATIEEYLKEIPDDRKEPVKKLRDIISENLPKGFREGMVYGMIGYVVPFSLYPSGYHTGVKQELPFMNLASQKNFIAVYHMGLYAEKELLDWFINEYPKHCKTKLDMGKGCIRFKNPATIPYELIGQLAAKMGPEQWIKIYEKNLGRK